MKKFNLNQVPVLLIIFNRPEKTRRVIESLRDVKPIQIFVAADGPRNNNDTDQNKCYLTRQAIEEIDWPCNLNKRYSEVNLGCDLSVPLAITWFFEHVEEGIILEDDCVPHPDYFRFCSELLPLYANDFRIMQISSFSPYPKRQSLHDYHFSRAFRCWGWATWRRSWAYYSDTLEIYDNYISKILESYYPFYAQRIELKKLYKIFRMKKRDNWDFKWNLACYAQNALSIVPEYNLMKNIGFDHEATHTFRSDNVLSNLMTECLPNNLSHPNFIYYDSIPETNLKKELYKSRTFKNKCAWKWRNLYGSFKDFLELSTVSNRK